MLKKYSRTGATVVAVAYSIYQFYKDDPKTAIGALFLMWPYAMVVLCAVIIWGYSDSDSDEKPRQEAWLAVASTAMVLLFALIWPCVTGANTHPKTQEETNSQIDFPSEYFPEYANELQTVQYIMYSAEKCGKRIPYYKVKKMLQRALEDGVIFGQCKEAGPNATWPIPKERIAEISETDNYGPYAPKGVKDQYERFYWSEEIYKVDWCRRPY